MRLIVDTADKKTSELEDTEIETIPPQKKTQREKGCCIWQQCKLCDNFKEPNINVTGLSTEEMWAERKQKNIARKKGWNFSKFDNNFDPQIRESRWTVST